MFRVLKCLPQLREFIHTQLGCLYMRVFLYSLIANFIACIHLGIIAGNIIALGCLIVLQPWYIWLPVLTLVSSPTMGGTHCLFNRIENIFRAKAGMPLITDRMEALLTRSK